MKNEDLKLGQEVAKKGSRIKSESGFVPLHGVIQDVRVRPGGWVLIKWHRVHMGKVKPYIGWARKEDLIFKEEEIS